MRLLAISLLLIPLATACASTGASEAPSSARAVITEQELEGVLELMTLDAIRRLRPNWLRSRAAPTPTAFRDRGVEPALRLDGIMRGGLEELQTLPVRDVREITFLSASEATTLYGTGYTNGVIQVSTRE
jgi:hypothetical protein